MSNDLEMQEIFGKDSEDWADRYNPDTVYPFEAMVYHIERNREGYTQELGGTDAGSGKIVLAQKFLDLVLGFGPIIIIAHNKFTDSASSDNIVA